MLPFVEAMVYCLTVLSKHCFDDASGPARQTPDTTCMKTFVYHDGALGDILLSLPCLERLKASSSWVHMVGRRNITHFLKDAGIAHAAGSTDQQLFASLYSALDSQLWTFLCGFSRAYVFTAQESPASATAIRTVIPDTRTIKTIPPDGSQMHAAQYRLSQIEPGTSHSGEPTLLRVPRERANAAQSLLLKAGYNPGAGLIAVHPGSGDRMKCWPQKRYFELIEHLQSAHDAFVILFTGDAEEGELQKEACRFVRARKNMLHADNLELMSAASLLSLCGLYIGNDAGFSHLAGILGCTAIVLFGPTDPLRWKPIGPRVEVVSTGSFGPMMQITVEDVIAKIKSALNTTSGPTRPTLIRSIADRGGP